MRTNRAFDELRPQKVTVEFIKGEKTSILYELGLTKVLCVATKQVGVPKFLEGKSLGWITAEYGMLPRCSPNRIPRERVKLSGRSQEIQRFVGRSLRAGCDLSKILGYSVVVDVDVIQADGGTRTASVNGGMIALYILLQDMLTVGHIESMPVISLVAAVSVGKMGEKILLDPDYREDSNLDVDMNVVMNADMKFVEIDGITEGNPFSATDLERMLSLAQNGIESIIRVQQEHLSLTIA